MAKQKLMLFAGNSHLEFARSVAEHIGVELHEPDIEDKHGKLITKFSNENYQVDIKCDVRGCHCFVIQTQAPPVNDHLMELFQMIRALKSAGAKVTAVMPYMPYIRSDKKDHERSVVGAKLIVDLLTVAGVSGILLMDPHFPQIHGFFDECKVKVDVLRAKPLFLKFIFEEEDLENYVVLSPDVNEAKHSGAMATMLGLQIAIVDKRREADNEEAIPSGIIGDVRNKRCLVFDDEVMSGKTLLNTMRYCTEQHNALSFDSYVTHPVLSKPEGVEEIHRVDFLHKAVFTDTIPIGPEKQHPKIKVVSVAPMFADAIKIIYEGGSLGAYKESLYKDLKRRK